MVDYMQDNMTLEELQEQLQKDFVAGAKDYARKQLDKGAKGWDWAKKYLD